MATPGVRRLRAASGRERLFGSLCGMVFLVNLARVVYAPLVEPLREALGMSAGTAGLVVTLTWLGSALPRLPTGYLLTRVPRHAVVLGAGGVLAGGALVAATATSVATLGLGALLMGLSSGVYFIAANPLVSELYPDRVGRAVGVHGTAMQLAAVLAPLVVGTVLVVATWRAVFLLVAGVAAAVTAAVYATALRTPLPTAGREDRDLLGAARRQWPLILTAVAVITAANFLWNGVFNFYVTYLTETKGLSSWVARSLLTLVFASGLPAFLVAGRLADRYRRVPLLLSVLAAFVGAVFALTVAQGLLAVAAVSVWLGYAVHSLFPVMDTHLLDSFPDENRASAYAVYSAIMMLLQAPGSAAVGALTDAGLAFDAVFRGFAAGVLGLLVLLVALQATGRLPSGASTGRPSD